MVWILAALNLIFLFILGFLWKENKKNKDSSQLLLMQQEMNYLRSQLIESLGNQTRNFTQQMNQITNQLASSQKTIDDRLENAAKIFGSVHQKLGELSKANEQILEIGQDISSLQEILRSPKLRGGIGEYLLGDLLSKILPAAHFSLQYEFKNGERVDAIIRLGKSLVPIDAKFSLENFQKFLEAATDAEKRQIRRKFTQDIQKHINDIANKYILPEEGTFDFALMYVPAENVYYEAFLRSDKDDTISLIDYALNKKIIPVSPVSFFAYLQAIVLGLRGLKIEETAKEILNYLSHLRIDWVKFQNEFEVLGTHLNNAEKKYSEVEKKLDRFGQRLLQIGEEKTESAEPVIGAIV
ncbi:MAG: DNA recombination protein RmuC [Elusimicrobiota bacterium]